MGLSCQWNLSFNLPFTHNVADMDHLAYTAFRRCNLQLEHVEQGQNALLRRESAA